MARPLPLKHGYACAKEEVRHREDDKPPEQRPYVAEGE